MSSSAIKLTPSDKPQTPFYRSDEDIHLRDAASGLLNNTHNAASSNSDVSTPTNRILFQTQTIAPSPPATASPPSASTSQDTPGDTIHQPPLRIQTDVHPTTPVRNPSLRADRPSSLRHRTSTSSLVSRTPSVREAISRALATPSSSTIPSPIIAAMGDVTPLPSPLLSSDSPGPWKKMRSPPPRESVPVANSVLVTSTGESITNAMAHHKQRKSYAGLNSDGPGAPPGVKGHNRNRSISEYVPDNMHIPKRMVTVSGSHAKAEIGRVDSPYEPQLRREPHLSEARGLTPIEKPPTPPPSESSLSAHDTTPVTNSTSKMPRHEYFEAYTRKDHKLRRWRAIKTLGQGTFARVMLATSQMSPPTSDYEHDTGLLTPELQQSYSRRSLVAIKVCEHGPRGGFSEDRIEMSLKRELEIMQSIHHPSVVHLKAWNIEPTRAILVLSYYPGRDLFDVASRHGDLLTPPLLRRMFAELVAAVAYLHDRRIVHRDIKLENVLVNLPVSELANTSTNWQTYPYPVVTLTDLGLSRRVADDERLETRCGSEDYAAPEVIMGQAYDGRATDAWSLGVLLYALLESRLPFDPAPGILGHDQATQVRMRSRTSHRIARVEWQWIEFGTPDGEEGDGNHEADVGKFEKAGLTGAREVVEGLLKRARSRWPLDKVAEHPWVKGGVQVEGGIRFREEDDGEEVVNS
jgi:protein-serine/threonine kinase